VVRGAGILIRASKNCIGCCPMLLDNGLSARCMGKAESLKYASVGHRPTRYFSKNVTYIVSELNKAVKLLRKAGYYERLFICG